MYALDINTTIEINNRLHSKPHHVKCFSVLVYH